MENLSGKLLIAIPDLGDGNFYRSVVLVFQHDSEGASGVILNRPSEITVGQVWDEISDAHIESDLVVNVGGPVEGPLLSLHTCQELSETEVIKGVYLSFSRENLNTLVADHTDDEYRIFSGYSGWGPGQLDQEMKVGGWLTFAARKEHVFGDTDKLWKSVCEDVGRDILKPHIGFRSPVDPSLN